MVTERQIKKLIQAIDGTWQDVSADATDSPTYEADLVVEICVDADRLKTSGYEEEDAIFKQLMKEKGSYSAALEFVASKMPFKRYEGGSW